MATVSTRANDAPFIERHGLWTDEQRESADQVRTRILDGSITQVRIGWGDQHGIVRGKTLSSDEFLRALESGKDFQTATLIFDTTNHPVVSPFSSGAGFGNPEMTGLPDAVLVPDPSTFRVLPWVKNTGWILCDMYFASGNPVPFSTRRILAEKLAELRALGYDYVAGLEIEFYLTRMEDPMLSPVDCGQPPSPPRVSAISHGFQYLTENRGDEIDDILQVLQRYVRQLDLPLLTIEDEWGPGQVEFTFGPLPGLQAADNVLLFRTAIKQICRRHGLHATFMSRPALPNFFSSGWHLHQSLVDREGHNVLAEPGDALSPLGRHYLAGLLHHATGASVLTNPTINGYKRFRPDSFAPDRIGWAIENRGAMIRVIGGDGSPSTRIENRIGEPTANPYLYVASQVICGLDGIRSELDPGAPAEEPYMADRPLLPASLMDALRAFEDDPLFRRELGEEFVDYLLAVKRGEVTRFLSHVTDWEHSEYFEMY
jgi:glutamine synthetase